MRLCRSVTLLGPINCYCADNRSLVVGDRVEEASIGVTVGTRGVGVAPGAARDEQIMATPIVHCSDAAVNGTPVLISTLSVDSVGPRSFSLHFTSCVSSNISDLP